MQNRTLMNRLFSILIAMLLLASCGTVSAQSAAAKGKAPAAFTADEFASQLLAFLNGSAKDEAKLKANAAAVESLTRIYGPMDAKTRKQVVDMYNALRSTKLAPVPDYLDLTTTLVAYQAAGGTLLAQWMEAVRALPDLTKKTKELRGFIDYSSDLLSTRTIYRSRSAVWQVQPGAPFQFQTTSHDVKTLFTSPVELTYSSGTASNSDANTIYGTTGVYYYLDNLWRGKGGRLTWERCGLPAGVCYADLNEYEAVAKFPKFTADSVQFVNTSYFKQPIRGRVEEQLDIRLAADKYSFPKFRSYQRDFKLKEMMPGVDFQGSFMMHGSRFVTNDEQNPASMIFYRQGRPFLVVSSTKFSLTPNVLTSERATVRLYLGNDSISNTGILVRYLVKDRKVALTNDPKRNYYSPYNDSYHQLDIYCESINWLQDKDRVEFCMVAQDNTRTFVTFESNAFYSERKDREVKGIDAVSPVVRVFNFMKDNGMKRDFSLAALARHVKLDEVQTKLLIHGLSKAGLVSFDEAANRIHVHDKLVGFYKAIMKQKGHDYDALTLESDTKGVNAELDLTSFDLRVHGIEKFVVSDSQLVVVKPYGGDITVKRNRDIAFSGHINVGRFNMNVTNAMFVYDQFKLDLPQIDSLRFKVTSFTDPNKTQWVRTPLYNLVGNIQIDMADNHCGLKKNKDYPIFNSLKPSFVYYDQPFIFGGAYVRDRFYYSLHPFVIKQLTDFKTDSLAFGGVLSSAGIFPDIAEPLKVQPDYSLGFVCEAPKGGYPAYGGRGTFHRKVDLSYRGLRGEGVLEYLAAYAKTDKYLFFPDSMMAKTDTFYVKEEDGFPEVHNSNTLLRWYPYSDSMTVSQLLNGPEFQMYRGEARLSGRIALQPKGASAFGTCSTHGGVLRSADFKLRSREMEARKTSFVLRSNQYDEETFRADNMRSLVNYDKQNALFRSNDSVQRALLTAINYAAFVDQYIWDWNRLSLALDNSKRLETGGAESLTLAERSRRLDKMPGARFESVTPQQKDIRFNAVGSTYLYDREELTARNVFALPIADALIAPAADTLHFSRGGGLSLLKGAQALFPRDSAFHLFHHCDLLVDNGQKYSGKGVIDYVGADQKPQPVTCSAIASGPRGSTADGFVPDSARFVLSSAFGFAGKVRIDAQHPDLFFDGGVRLLHNCAPIEQLGLLAYADYLDPANIRIAVPENPTDWKGNRINAAIRMDQSSLRPVSSFLTKHQNGTELLCSYGLLHYDDAAKTYTITSQEKLDDPDLVARTLTLHTDDCIIEGEGPVTFGLSEGPASCYAYGTARLDPADEKEFRLNTVFGLNFPIDNGLLSQWAQQIEDDLRPEPADRDNDLLHRALIYGMGAEKGHDAFLSYLGLGAFEKMPKCIDNTILFENVKWEYSPQRGYTASGKAALCNIGKKQLHVNVNIKAQLFKKGTETTLVLYMQVARDHWYYMRYEFKQQRLSITSSVGEWNDRLLSIDKDKRKVDGFTYVRANSQVEINNFLTAFGGGPISDEEEEE